MATRLSILLAILLLAACGIYFPSQREREAKQQLVANLRSTLQDLPRAADFAIAKVPGTEIDDVHFWGNFRGFDARLDAKYYSDLEPAAVCNMYHAFFDTNATWATGYRAAHDSPICSVRRSSDYSFAVIDADKTLPPNSREKFHLHVVVTTSDHIWKRDGKIWRSSVEIHMFHTLDQQKSSSCVPEEMRAHLKWPCEDADWKEHASKTS